MVVQFACGGGGLGGLGGSLQAAATSASESASASAPALALAPTPITSQAGSRATCDIANFQVDLLALINWHRADVAICGERGSFPAAGALAWSDVLANASTGSDGSNAGQRITASGYAGQMLRQTSTTLAIDSPGRGLLEISSDVSTWVARSGITEGLCTLFIRHTSASLLVQENADPEVRGDLDRFLARLVPDGDALFRHRDEGPDDMPAHVRAALTAVQLSVPVSQGRPVLGTWQGIYLWEHRRLPHRRDVVLHLLGA